MLDLCRFKEVNDTLGHNIGDRVLCDVAQRFAKTLASRGFIARIGGDEFTVVLEQAENTETIANTSQALADCLRAPIDVMSRRAPMSDAVCGPRALRWNRIRSSVDRAIRA